MKNIIFDIGNVLINYDFEIFFEKLGYKKYERSLMEAHSPIFAFECGELETEDFMQQLQAIYKPDMDAEEFKDAWCDVFWANDELLDIVPQLVNDHRLMILSNNDELHFPFIWDKYLKLHVFEMENVMITSRLGFIKPDIRVFQSAMQSYNFDWKDSIFIDDVKENVEVAKRLGAVTIWHQNNTHTIRELENILKSEII
ncbi:MAG: HAD-IA family hydrolase [Candidatus Stygibacter frigidus]|nr:HAD-IA family hydrolase [Candidatus Stygibacter frigidus]